MSPSISQQASRIRGIGIRYRLIADGAIVERATGNQVAFICNRVLQPVVDAARGFYLSRCDTAANGLIRGGPQSRWIETACAQILEKAILGAVVAVARSHYGVVEQR